MKELILTLIRNPVILLSVASLISISGILGIVWTSRYPKLFQFAEWASILFAIFCLTEVTLKPFFHWNLGFLVVGAKNALITSLQLFIYGYIVLILRFKILGLVKRELPKFASIYIFKNPFFWIIPPLGLASCLWSETPGVTFGASFLLITINLFCVYLSAHFSWDELFAFLRIDASLVAFGSFLIRNKTNAGTTEGGGLAGILFSKNYLGSLMAFAAVLWLVESLRPRRRPWISIAMTLICLVLLVQARSGGGYFLFLALTAVALSGQVLKKFRYSFAVFITALYFFVTIVVGFFLFANLESILGAFGKDLSFTGRTEIWPSIWRAVLQRFWFGYGVRGFWQYWRGSENPSIDWISGYWQPPSAHMGYLDAWVELGLVGLALILAALVVSCLQALAYLIRTKGSSSLLPLLTLVYVIMGNLAESRFLRPNFTWFVLSLVTIKLIVGEKSPVSADEAKPLDVADDFRLSPAPRFNSTS